MKTIVFEFDSVADLRSQLQGFLSQLGHHSNNTPPAVTLAAPSTPPVDAGSSTTHSAGSPAPAITAGEAAPSTLPGMETVPPPDKPNPEFNPPERTVSDFRDAYNKAFALNSKEAKDLVEKFIAEYGNESDDWSPQQLKTATSALEAVVAF